MSSIIRASSKALVLASFMLAGCAGDGSDGIFTTGALGTSSTVAAAPAPEPKVDPACVTLATRIDVLRREGVGDKIEKAAAKKYTLTKSDLAKADQLTKANAEFQQRCTNIAPLPTSAQAPSTPAKAKSAPKAAANATTPAAPKN